VVNDGVANLIGICGCRELPEARVMYESIQLVVFVSSGTYDAPRARSTSLA
jgi:hypothetical protein